MEGETGGGPGLPGEAAHGVGGAPPSVKATLHPDFCYLRVRLVVKGAEEQRGGLFEERFQKAILTAVQSLFGSRLAGAALCDQLVFMKYVSSTNTGIIRVPARHVVGFWGALTLFSGFDQLSCRMEVERVSTFLPSLASSSRNFFDDFAGELGLRKQELSGESEASTSRS